MVRDFLASVTADELATARRNPWNPEYQETTMSCLHVILEEEWEHHRYAVRDLDIIEGEPNRSSLSRTRLYGRESRYATWCSPAARTGAWGSEVG